LFLLVLGDTVTVNNCLHDVKYLRVRGWSRGETNNPTR
jgi:hypothetical protein